MLKILKKLIKSNSDYYKKYVLIYKTNINSDYNFMYCTENELIKELEQTEMFQYHIFLTKDELKIETNIELDIVEKVEE